MSCSKLQLNLEKKRRRRQRKRKMILLIVVPSIYPIKSSLFIDVTDENVSITMVRKRSSTNIFPKTTLTFFAFFHSENTQENQYGTIIMQCFARKILIRNRLPGDYLIKNWSFSTLDFIQIELILRQKRLIDIHLSSVDCRHQLATIFHWYIFNQLHFFLVLSFLPSVREEKKAKIIWLIEWFWSIIPFLVRHHLILCLTLFHHYFNPRDLLNGMLEEFSRPSINLFEIFEYVVFCFN